VDGKGNPFKTKKPVETGGFVTREPVLLCAKSSIDFHLKQSCLSVPDYQF
jgi:hypothetical protein